MLNFNKLFKGGEEKALGLQAISRLIGQGTWASNNYLGQYEKSLYLFASIQKIAQKVASITVSLHEIINSKGEVREIASHEALDLIYKPNPFQTKTEFWKLAIINKKLSGECFMLKVRNDRGQVVELWNLRPDLITVVADEVNYVSHYELEKPDGSGKIRFERDDVIHYKEPNPSDLYRGISPLRPAQYRLETEEYASKYQRDFFLNNARPDAFLVTEELLSPDQKAEIRLNFEARHKGKGKGGKLGILEGGMKYQQVSISQREMDYIESMKFTRDDILVAFGVPKSVITTDDVNLANAETGMFVFLSETIKPEMQGMVEVLNENLIATEFSDSLYLDFEDPTPENRTTKLAEYTAGVDKWLTRNEIRDDLNLEPMDGGDILYNNLGAVPLELTPSGDEPTVNQLAFKGKYALKKKFELAEKLKEEFSTSSKLYKDIENEAIKTLRKAKKLKNKEVKKERKMVSVIKGELRDMYSDMVNKAIDRKTNKFKKKVQSEAGEQAKRVISALETALKSVDGMAIVEKSTSIMGKVFDKEEENKLFAEFSLPFLTGFLFDAGNEALSTVKPGSELLSNAKIEKYLKARSEFFASSVNDTTHDKLAKTLSEGIKNGEGIGDLTNRVKDVYVEFPQHRAELIARTETTAVNNEGFVEGYKQSGVVEGKEWIATLDDRTREEHVALDGEKVGLNEQFSNGLKYPQEPNCRCVIAPVVLD